MRVLYLYRSSRMAIYQKALSEETSDFPLYGLNHLRELGVEADFFDEDRTLGNHLKRAQQISRGIIDRTQLGWNIGQAIRSLKRIRDYDLVFATADSTGLPLAFLKRLGLFETALVIASQGLCQSLQLKGWNWAFRLHRWSLEAVDHVVFYGWAEGSKLHEWFNVPESRLTWLPIGVDDSFFSPETFNAELATEDVVLSVGRDRCRDYPSLLEVALKLPLRFRIITSRRNLAGTDVPANVEVLFDLPVEEVRRHYASSRLVVLPIKSSSYSFGTTVFFECLSMQKPIIVSRTEAVGTGTNGYRVQNGVHCRFVPVGDGEALCRAIDKLWGDPELCKAMGRRGRMLVEQEYNTRAFARRLVRLFEALR